MLVNRFTAFVGLIIFAGLACCEFSVFFAAGAYSEEAKLKSVLMSLTSSHLTLSSTLVLDIIGAGTFFGFFRMICVIYCLKISRSLTWLLEI